MFHIRQFASAIAIFLASAATGWADALTQPTDSVVLTVSGDIAVKNSQNTAEFDLAMLRDLGSTSFETTTIWTEGVQTFEGVSLNQLLERLDVAGGTLIATAVNDYSVEIPVNDATPSGPIIAFRHNGALMSLRDKGPLWIVYPYDNNPNYKSEVIYARSIWQLDRIEVLQ